MAIMVKSMKMSNANKSFLIVYYVLKMIQMVSLKMNEYWYLINLKNITFFLKIIRLKTTIKWLIDKFIKIKNNNINL